MWYVVRGMGNMVRGVWYESFGHHLLTYPLINPLTVEEVCGIRLINLSPH